MEKKRSWEVPAWLRGNISGMGMKEFNEEP
jgi:hypothetical protein